MRETKASRSLINKPLARGDQSAIPVKNLAFTEQSYMGLFGSDIVFHLDYGTCLFFYHQRWKQEIYNRFQEARNRFPEFFPCFELKYNSEGLQYSIHFKPLTKHAEALMRNAPLFPNHEKFKPIEQLWSEDGQNELELIFERFPAQLALNPPKEPWGGRWRRLFLGLVNQGLELAWARRRSCQGADR